LGDVIVIGHDWDVHPCVGRNRVGELQRVEQLSCFRSSLIGCRYESNVAQVIPAMVGILNCQSRFRVLGRGERRLRTSHKHRIINNLQAPSTGGLEGSQTSELVFNFNSYYNSY
jgi:hypothetical protein